MKTNTLTPELLHKMDAYWRAANSSSRVDDRRIEKAFALEEFLS